MNAHTYIVISIFRRVESSGLKSEGQTIYKASLGISNLKKMDSWLKQTILSDNQDLSTICFKLLSWLDTEFCGTMTYKHIETILTSAVFVDIIFEMMGEELTKDLMEKYAHHRLFLKDHCKRLSEVGVTLKSAANILATPDGYKYIFTVENLLKHLLTEVNLIYNNSMVSPKIISNDNSKYKMHLIVERIFQLPPKNIDISVDRMLSHCDFSLIGHIFLEDTNNLHISKYKILEYKICTKIAKGNISPSFIKSMYVTASSSLKGNNFLKSCLRNDVFGTSLIEFFILFFENIEREGYNMTVNSQHNLSDIIFLVHCALCSNTPSISQLSNTIRTNETVAKLIKKSFFIYY
ncbi:uncharacterized protein LOC105233113 isoform X2 [Bactrocera dorsalis]|uniref:Uncharacterized protein LOC105233113 isoform X2 n=2 Tax=Bactrocera dorsalis TaxID=27457 RepID=A0A6I9VP89_BACDO|nr:uncharacterized protein LOC105233113 isoform X2 [Bactrocera dorsalis]